MIPFSGFMPDADPTTDGVITDCSNLVPTVKGYKTAASNVSAGIAALSGTSYGASVVTLLSGNRRVFAGTDTKLYEASGTTWTDRSRAGNYTSGEKAWRFAQFGDYTFACNKVDTLQYSTGVGVSFADVATAPKARHIATSAGFVMLADTNDGTFGDQSDRWWCSAIYDGTTWTPSVATQATSGRIVDAPGPITGLKALGDKFVIYKRKAMFLGSYVGSPIVWAWTQVPGEIGVETNEAVVNVGTYHLFIGPDDFYMFDGTIPQPIGAGVREWFFGRLNKAYAYKISSLHDRTNGVVYWFYPSTASTSGTLDSCVCFNYRSKKWGRMDRNVECAVEYVTQSATIDSLTGTIDALTYATFDSPFWNASSPVPALFDTTHTLVSLTGASSGGTLTTGDAGDDAQFSTLRRTRLRCTSSPSSASASNSYRNVEGDALTSDSTSSMEDGKFDFLRSARWHRLSYTLIGDCEVIGHALDLQPDGTA